MDVRARDDDELALRVRLDLHLDRRPIRGRLRSEWGADEWFVGWLGFVDALKRLNELRELSADGDRDARAPRAAPADGPPEYRKEPE